MSVPEYIYTLRDSYKQNIDDFKKEARYYENQAALQYFDEFPFDQKDNSNELSENYTQYIYKQEYYNTLIKNSMLYLKEIEELILKWENDNRIFQNYLTMMLTII